MTHLTLGGVRYRLSAVERDGRWIARASREDTGDPCGVECDGATEGEATAHLTRWLEWQAEHAAALADLQQAERGRDAEGVAGDA